MAKEKINKFAEQDKWENWIGLTLVKHSDKPFKSGKKKGVAVKLTTNPNSGRKAFKMDDDSVVDCFQVKPVEI